jgi:predicted enzyme related to lactoylglutathione lyase
MNAINWFELPATDIDRAINFYSTILNNPLRKGEFGGMPHGFFPMDEDGVGGALVLSPNHVPSDDRGVVIYLNAGNDLDGILSRVQGAGGKVVMPKTAIPPQGWIAWIRDIEGNQVGLHQSPAQS